MTEHTRGPWTRCGEDRGGCKCGYIFGHSGQVYVAQAIGEGTVDPYLGPDPYPTNDVALANARLITAAPELLAAIKGLVSDILEYEEINNLAASPGYKDCWQSVTQARAVIAKAEGSSLTSPEQTP